MSLTKWQISFARDAGEDTLYLKSKSFREKSAFA
jgi:hypothetical protein